MPARCTGSTSSSSAVTSPARHSRRLVRDTEGRYRCRFVGTDYEVEAGPDLEALEKLIADHGYYHTWPNRASLTREAQDGTLDTLFLDLDASPVSGSGSSSPTNASGRPAAGYSSCSATNPAELRRSSTRPRGASPRGPGRRARRRPRDHLVGVLEHHAVAQSPRDDRGPLAVALRDMAARLQARERAMSTSTSRRSAAASTTRPCSTSR